MEVVPRFELEQPEFFWAVIHHHLAEGLESKEVGTFGAQFKWKYKLFANVWAGD